jgi:serine/threonine protein kinase
MATHRLALPAGFRLENYLFMDTLGKGGFGITYQARDLLLNRVVAVKELLPDGIATRVDGSTVVAQSEAHESDWRWARDRFLKEAQVVASFRHPNIVNVHRLIEANGTVYMVMDLLDGGSYQARLDRIKREPDEARVRAVIDPLLDGLVEVHRAGMLHRDIKPDNILFNHRGEPVLADFGAAREIVGRTMALTSIITTGYSPLEQYQSKDGLQGPWTDIYALGAVMVRAITGEKPPAATDRLGKDTYERLAAKPRPGFSAEFLKAVDHALRMEPKDRPQEGGMWRRALFPPAKSGAPVLALVAPKGGERWTAGSEQKIRWKVKAPGMVSIKGVDVELWHGDQLVETLQVGVGMANSQVAWKIPADQAIGSDYHVKLVVRGEEGRAVTTSAAGRFSIVSKPTPQPGSHQAPTRRNEDTGEKILAGIFWLACLWLIFGGWRVVWTHVFPHLPQAAITWVNKQHPTWAPGSQWPDLSGLKGLKLDTTKGWDAFSTPGLNSPFPTQTSGLIKPSNSPSITFGDLGLRTPQPTPRGFFGNTLLTKSPAPSVSPTPYQLPTRLTVPDRRFPGN